MSRVFVLLALVFVPAAVVPPPERAAPPVAPHDSGDVDPGSVFENAGDDEQWPVWSGISRARNR